MEGGIRNGKQDEKWGEGACWPSNWTDYDQLTFWCVLSLGQFRRSSSAPVGGGGGGILCYPLLSKHANQSRLFGPCHCCCCRCCCCHVVDSIDWIYSSSWNSRPRWWRRCREHSIRRLLWKTGHNLLSARRRSVFHRNNQIIITISTRARERERGPAPCSFESGCAPSSGKQPLGWWTIIYILFIYPARYVPVVSNFQAPAWRFDSLTIALWMVAIRFGMLFFFFETKNNLLSASLLARF